MGVAVQGERGLTDRPQGVWVGGGAAVTRGFKKIEKNAVYPDTQKL